MGTVSIEWVLLNTQYGEAVLHSPCLPPVVTFKPRPNSRREMEPDNFDKMVLTRGRLEVSDWRGVIGGGYKGIFGLRPDGGE